MTAGRAANPASPRRRFTGSGGVVLAAEVWGAPDAPPLVLLHGGGQTRGAWGTAGRRLAARGWRVVAADLRGHGQSGWSPDGSYDIDLFADDVRALVAALGGRPVLVGASLGGLSSLLAAGEAPRAAVRALVLVDVAHRPDPAGARRILDFMAARPDGFSSLDEVADAVAAYLPHRRRPEALDGLRRNLRREGARWVWHWDPRLLKRLADSIHPAGAAARDQAAARHLAAARAAGVPILLVRGAISDVVPEAIAAEFCVSVPCVHRVEVAGAGHMVAGDRNEHFIEAILPFLTRIREST
ncbi:alpha/beta hydrolase [Actinomadura fulvescens]|uniref:Alpha/beta fold hydrolase n=1 Tax=Actinomadura fulvescens TaxID=46160 RepID=A0ABP6DBK7_9ACTN